MIGIYNYHSMSIKQLNLCGKKRYCNKTRINVIRSIQLIDVPFQVLGQLHTRG